MARLYSHIKNKEKGDCMKSAGNLIMDIEDALLVHAVIEGQGKLKGRKILHAWVEINGYVLDFSNGRHFCMKKENYYALAKPSFMRKYSQETALKFMDSTGHFGTWEEGFENGKTFKK